MPTALNNVCFQDRKTFAPLPRRLLFLECGRLPNFDLSGISGQYEQGGAVKKAEIAMAESRFDHRSDKGFIRSRNSPLWLVNLMMVRALVRWRT
jgi:hypothetical protein